ncbi:MAG: hypothetical protein ACREXX_10735 [Gammaproteobacteria bacterium]
MHRNYLYREALRPIYLFFDKQDIDEANIRMRKLPPVRASAGRSVALDRAEPRRGSGDGRRGGIRLIDTILARGDLGSTTWCTRRGRTRAGEGTTTPRSSPPPTSAAMLIRTGKRACR